MLIATFDDFANRPSPSIAELRTSDNILVTLFFSFCIYYSFFVGYQLRSLLNSTVNLVAFCPCNSVGENGALQPSLVYSSRVVRAFTFGPSSRILSLEVKNPELT